MKFVDCDAVGLGAKSHHRCMRIKFGGSNATTEYAGLNMVDGEKSVLKGPLYDVGLKLKKGASVMLDIEDDGSKSSVSCTGEGGSPHHHHMFIMWLHHLVSFFAGNHL